MRPLMLQITRNALQSVNTTTVVDASKYLTLVGVVAAFVSTLMAHGFLSLSRKLKAGAADVPGPGPPSAL